MLLIAENEIHVLYKYNQLTLEYKIKWNGEIIIMCSIPIFMDSNKSQNKDFTKLVDVVEWSRALGVRLSEWCCSVSMV